MTAPSPRTLLGPLTTTWTPPVGCLYGVASACATCTTVWLGQMCNMDGLIYDATDCWPPRPPEFNSDPGVMMGWGFYSPGVHCPAGYSTAAMATSGGLMGWDVEYLMTAGETAAACCPTGYSISNIQTLGTSAQTCVTTATAGSFSTAHCAAGRYTDVSEARLPQTLTGGAVQSRFVLFAPLFQLNFRSADITAAATTSSSSASRTAGSSSSTASVLPGAIPSDGASSGPDGSNAETPVNGLTQAQKAGIGIGIAAVAVLLGFLLFFIFRRIRRQKMAAAGKHAADAEKNGAAIPPGTASEVDGQEVKELEAVDRPQEALAPVPMELPIASAKGERASRETQEDLFELPGDNPSTAERPWLG